MIYVNVTGRCGNQLFQYAFARKLSVLTNDTDFKIDFYNVRRWQKKTGDKTFENSLKDFCVLPFSETYENEKVLETKASKRQRNAVKKNAFFRKVFIRLLKTDNIWQRFYEKKLNRLGIYYNENKYTTPRTTNEKDKFLKGYFENPAYFDDIKDILIKEFTPLSPESEKNKELYEKIKSTESVCVSFRKWGEVDDSVKRERQVCGKEYYKAALEEIKKRVQNPTLFVFSDDIAWVKENFDFGDLPVFFEDGTDKTSEKLRLMYSCKHFIMTTSTFTWWAQYLCRNKNKVVISPTRWDNTGKTNYLIDENWIKI